MSQVKEVVVTPELFDRAPRLSCGDSFVGEFRRCDGYDQLLGVRCTARKSFKFIFAARPGTTYILDFSGVYDRHLGAKIVVRDTATGKEEAYHNCCLGSLVVEIVPMKPATYEVTVGPMTDVIRVDRDGWKWDYVSINFKEFGGALRCRPTTRIVPP
jgi:hypothetical protein